jgi:hypothetical protein
VISAVVIVQLALAPFPGVYAAGALPLGVLNDHRARWLSVVSFFWPLVAVPAGKPLATALALVLPLVGLALVRWREQKRSASGGSQPGNMSGALYHISSPTQHVTPDPHDT